jgi:ketosteroid isomerase-like protein
MKKLMILVSVLLMAGCTQAPQTDLEGLKATIDVSQSAFEASDPVAIAAIYAEDGAVMSPNSETVTGQAAIEDFWMEVLASGIDLGVAKTTNLYAHGDVGYEVGTYAVTEVDGDIDEGKYVRIWRHGDGKWRLQHVTWNSNLPLSAPESALRDADVAAIRQADLAWSAAQASDGLDGVMPFYLDDAILLPPNSPMVIGKEAIREASAAIDSPGFSVSWKPMKVEVAQSGELGYAIGNFEGNIVDSAGNLVPVKGKYVEIWKKQADGSWKIAVDMPSTDSPSGPIF